MLLFTYLNNRVRRHINNATRAAGWVASESLHRCCFSPCQGELKPSRRIQARGGRSGAISPNNAMTVGFIIVVHCSGGLCQYTQYKQRTVSFFLCVTSYTCSSGEFRRTPFLPPDTAPFCLRKRQAVRNAAKAVKCLAFDRRMSCMGIN